MDSILKYYCDRSFKRDDDKKWFFLLEIAFNKCDTVEFNILRKGYNTVPEINELLQQQIRKSKKKDKIYSSGYSIEFRWNDKLKDFIKSKSYAEWYSFYFEDIAFLRDGKEILSTITHENYVIMLMTDYQREELNKKGFNFSSDWGPEPFR